MAKEPKSSAATEATLKKSGDDTRFYLIQQGKELDLVESATFPDLEVPQGERLKKIICSHKSVDVVEKVIKRQLDELGLTVRSRP